MRHCFCYTMVQKVKSKRFKVIPRLFTAHPHSYNNDLQTTLWVTHMGDTKMFLFFSNVSTINAFVSENSLYGMGCRGQLLFPFHKRLFSLTKALIVETFEKNKNIFVPPIASFVNHCYKKSKMTKNSNQGGGGQEEQKRQRCPDQVLNFLCKRQSCVGDRLKHLQQATSVLHVWFATVVWCLRDPLAVHGSVRLAPRPSV